MNRPRVCSRVKRRIYLVPNAFNITQMLWRNNCFQGNHGLWEIPLSRIIYAWVIIRTKGFIVRVHIYIYTCIYIYIRIYLYIYIDMCVCVCVSQLQVYSLSSCFAVQNIQTYPGAGSRQRLDTRHDKMATLVFWGMTPCRFVPWFGDVDLLGYVGTCIQVYTVSHIIRILST